MPAARHAAIVAARGRPRRVEDARPGRAAAGPCSSSPGGTGRQAGRRRRRRGPGTRRRASCPAAARPGRRGGRITASSGRDQSDLGGALADHPHSHRPAAGGRWSSACGRCRTGTSADARVAPRPARSGSQPELPGRGQQRGLGRVAQPPSRPGAPPDGRSAASLHRAAAASSSATSGAAPASSRLPVPHQLTVRLRSRCRLSSAVTAGVHSRRATIRPSVRVPVLSVARMVTEPRVSTAGRRRTSALRAAIRRAPAPARG